jgi:hypothetical protein
MANHVYEKHQGCNNPNCPVCDGSMTRCVVCGGSQGALTTDCPGELMLQKTLEMVDAGKMDFRGGEWINLKHTGMNGNRLSAYLRPFTMILAAALMAASVGIIVEINYLVAGNFEMAQKLAWIVSPYTLGVSAIGIALWILKFEWVKVKNSR